MVKVYIVQLEKGKVSEVVEIREFDNQVSASWFIHMFNKLNRINMLTVKINSGEPYNVLHATLTTHRNTIFPNAIFRPSNTLVELPYWSYNK